MHNAASGNFSWLALRSLAARGAKYGVGAFDGE
jgi:hypothetical protein